MILEKEFSSGSESEDQYISTTSLGHPASPYNEPPSSSNDSGSFESFNDRLAGILSVIIALTLISGVYFSQMFLVYIPWMHSRLRDGTAQAHPHITQALWTGIVLFNVFGFLGLWAFFISMFANNKVPSETGEARKESKPEVSGHCPEESRPEVSRHNPRTAQHQTMMIRRWCRKCNQEKPPRSHHCSICNVCVMKMDHHCPWINNCVGLVNHGNYLRFLLFITAAMLVGLLLMASRLFTLQGKYIYLNSTGASKDFGGIVFNEEFIQMIVLIVDITASGILSLIIGLMLAVQINNIISGQTTIETLEVAQCKKNLEQESIPFPFDLGVWRNLQSVLGVSWWLWPIPLPIKWNHLDGVTIKGRRSLNDASVHCAQFETRPDALMSGQWPLPSKDPLLKEQLQSQKSRHRQGSLTDGGGFMVPNQDYYYTSEQ